MTATVEITKEHAAIVRGILRRFLPAGSRVLAFGSRVTGGARPYSDLDLAIDYSRPLGLDLTSQITEAFSESDLPYRVDIVDLSMVDPGFRPQIMSAGIPFYF